MPRGLSKTAKSSPGPAGHRVQHCSQARNCPQQQAERNSDRERERERMKERERERGRDRESRIAEGKSE